jgi:hypothetical protein
MITGCIFTSGIGRVVSNSTNLPQIATDAMVCSAKPYQFASFSIVRPHFSVQVEHGHKIWLCAKAGDNCTLADLLTVAKSSARPFEKLSGVCTAECPSLDPADFGFGCRKSLTERTTRPL